MKILTLTITLLMALAQTPVAVKLNDPDVLTGGKWTGTLTYLDYGTGKSETIPVEMKISGLSPGTYQWETIFPKETSHNSTDKVVISADGKIFDGETVIARQMQADGKLKFVTQKAGEDDGKQATYRITYLLSKTYYSRKKEVCYKGQTQYFLRNQYLLKR